jgi:hypothetical protein
MMSREVKTGQGEGERQERKRKERERECSDPATAAYRKSHMAVRSWTGRDISMGQR